MTRRTFVKGRDIEDESVTGDDVLDGSITRADLNTTSIGNAIVTKIIAGANVSFESTGVEEGTGDVTINASGSDFDENVLFTFRSTGDMVVSRVFGHVMREGL